MNSAKRESMNLTEGKILPLIVKFMIPLMLSSLLQQLYGAVDSAVVGKFSGAEALAAVGATAPITHLILALFIGMSMGAGIITAQLIGAKDDEGVEKAVHTSVALGIISGLFLMVFGVILAGPLLKLMNTPKEVLPLAKTYMSIYFLGSVPSIFYNFAASILRAAGDSKNPLKFLCIATVINIVFNLIFVIVFKMGVVGVAVSTIISQTVSAYLALRLLLKTNEVVKLSLSKIGIDKHMLKRIVIIGVPAGIQGATFNFSNTIIQSTLNSFGKAAVAGGAASGQIEGFLYLIMNAVALSATTFVGQNFGAKKLDRCRSGTRVCLFLVIFLGFLLGLLTTIFSEELIRMFVSETESVICGKERLVIIAISYFICGIMEVISYSLRGYGDSFAPMVISLLTVPGVRIFWCFAVLPIFRTVEMLYVAFPVSWLITTVVLTVRYIIFRKKVIV